MDAALTGSVGMNPDAEDDASRELLNGPQAKTAMRTSHCCNAARLMFLLAHGIFLLCVAENLDTLNTPDGPSWWRLFTPIWIGDALCVTLLISSWFASCPYMKLCVSERQPRVGIENPSILTDILPEIIFSIIGLFFMLLIFFGHWTMCGYLAAAQSKNPVGFHSPAALLIVVALLSTCHGVLLTHNSPLYLFVGLALFVGTVLFAIARGRKDAQVQAELHAFIMLPVCIGVLGFFCVGISRLRWAAKVLRRQELLLRIVELLALLALLLVLCLLSIRLASEGGDASSELAAVGICLIVIGALRSFMVYFEASSRPIEERVLSWRIQETPRVEVQTGSELYLAQRTPPAVRPGDVRTVR